MRSLPRLRPRRHLAFGMALLPALALGLVASACTDGAPAPAGSSEPSGTDDVDADSGATTPSPTDAGRPEASARSTGNTVDITVTGDLNATLKGAAGTCGGAKNGASFQVRSEELEVEPSFKVAVVVLSEVDWAKPTMTLSVAGAETVSYAWDKASGTVVAKRDRSRVDIDAKLTRVGGAGSVTIKGSIVCDP